MKDKTKNNVKLQNIDLKKENLCLRKEILDLKIDVDFF